MTPLEQLDHQELDEDQLELMRELEELRTQREKKEGRAQEQVQQSVQIFEMEISNDQFEEIMNLIETPEVKALEQNLDKTLEGNSIRDILYCLARVVFTSGAGLFDEAQKQEVPDWETDFGKMIQVTLEKIRPVFQDLLKQEVEKGPGSFLIAVSTLLLLFVRTVDYHTGLDLEKVQHLLPPDKREEIMQRLKEVIDGTDPDARTEEGRETPPPGDPEGA